MLQYNVINIENINMFIDVAPNKGFKAAPLFVTNFRQITTWSNKYNTGIRYII